MRARGRARAGVGKATVYRSFPTREHLVAAVVSIAWSGSRPAPREGLADPDRRAGLAAFMSAPARRAAADRSLSKAIAAGQRHARA